MDAEIKQMAEQLYQEQKRIEEDAAKEITATTILGALGGALFPVIGAGVGIYHLAKGRSSKGFLYLGLAVVGWAFTCLLISGR